MSTTLPTENLPVDLVQQLLQEQQSLTAVEQFSAHHDQSGAEHFNDEQSGEEQSEPAQARYYQKLLPATPPGPGQQFAFEVQLDKCSGCKACVVACHTLNGLEEDESWRRVGTITIGESQPRVQHVTTACHHCEDPGCLNGCPVKAYEKDPVTGIVRHLDDQCIGCKYCTMMCPYEVPQYSERLGIVRKCDMCHQRLSAGEAPACVQSCPNEAISIRIVVSGATFSGSDSLAVGAPPSSITTPTTIYTSQTTSPESTAVPQDQGVDDVAESHWPLAFMLVATQISVGILSTERIAAAFAMMIGDPIPESAARRSATLALIIAGVGMGVAPLHLGQPLRAWRVFLGLRTSWLSREAVVLGKYMGLLSVAVGLLWMPLLQDSGLVPAWVADWLPAWIPRATLGLAVLVGVAGLISSAMIYIVTRRKLWRSRRTFTRFLGTAAFAGAAWATVALIFADAAPTIILFVALFALAGVAGKLAWEWKTHLASSGTSDDDYDIRSRRLIAGPLSKTTRQRIQITLGGLGLLLVATLIGFWSPVFGALIGMAAASAITLGELGERILYFQSVVYDRMPGTLQ